MAQHIEKAGVIDAPVEKVFKAVADVTKYPEFLAGVKSVKQEGDEVEMTVGLGPTNVTWKSKVTSEENKFIEFKLIEGPFSQMDGRWDFTDEGDKTGVKYVTDFELKMNVPGIEGIAAKAIEANTNSTIEAFKKRILG